jgi:integrase
MIRLKYILQDRDRHGNRRVYVRIKGRGQIRLRETPGTPEFLDEYKAALAQLREGERVAKATSKATTPGSLSALCQLYMASPAFLQGLDESTRRVRRRLLDRICLSKTPSGIQRGTLPYNRMEAKHVRQIRDERADKPEAANSLVKALRQVFAWATQYEYVASNPARDVTKFAPTNPDGWHTWTPEEVTQYEACHPLGTKAHLAMSLLLYTGVRRSDVVTFGRQMERDEWLHWTEHKGRSKIRKDRALPILPQLRESIDACPSDNFTYLVTAYGKPFTTNGFGNKFKDWCREAGLPHCTAHGLRKAGATMAAENGATEYELMAIFGWESPKQAAIYTKKANRRKLVGNAMHLITPREQESNESVAPEGGVEEVLPKRGRK